MMEKPPLQFEMKVTAYDVTISNNFTDSLAHEWETTEDGSDMKPYALHHLVKEGRTDEIYNLLVTSSTDRKRNLHGLANTLDYNGLAALHYAVMRPSTVAARMLLDNKFAVDVQSKFGETPLHLAIRHGQLELANLFMDRGADVSKIDSSGNNALHLSIERGLKSITIKILTKSPSLVSSTNNTGNTPLHFAALFGDASLCEKVLLCGNKVTSTNINGETPMHIASLMNHLESLIILVEKGCTNVDEKARFLSIKRKDSLTALHVAAKMGHVGIVRFIINMGVGIDAYQEKKITALALAAGMGHVAIMELLLQNGAQVGATDPYGNTPLHTAARAGQVKPMHVLIVNSADIEATNDEGWTPLFYAVWKNQYEAAEFLLKNGADCTRVDMMLCSCLHYAAREGFCKMAYLLIRTGGDKLIFQRNNENRLPLHEAVLAGREQILERLLMRCSGTIIYSEEGKTLIHVAAEHGKVYCLQKLVNVWPRDYINMTDNKKRTALHLAAMNGHRCSVHLLIKGKADVHRVDEDGQKAHHLAILNRHNGVLKEFLDAKVEMFPEDSYPAISSDNVEAMVMIMDYLTENYVSEANFKYKGFNQVLEGDHDEIAEAIVEHYSFNIGVRNNIISLDEVMPTMITKYPDVALKILDKGISFSNHRPSSPDFQIDYDFTALETSPDFSGSLFGNELYFGPALMAKLDRMECLRHPLTQKMMNIKWNLHGALVYYATLLLYLTFTILLTTFIILHREFKLEQFASNSTQSSCWSCSYKQLQHVILPGYLTRLAISIFAFTCLQMLKELGQLVVTKRSYFRDVTNLYEWTVIISIIIYLNGGALFRNYTSENTELFFAIFCLIFVWLDILLFLRRSPLFNIYVVMFMQVVLTLVRVIIVFTPLLLAFGLVFHQLFLKQSQFKNFGYALMKISVMFTGELEYSDTVPNSLGKTSNRVPLVPLPALSFTIFLFFIVAIPVALMNLLVGLAVGDIDSIRKTAKYNVLKQQALYIENLHSKCPKSFIKLAYKRYHTEKPNQNTIWNWFTTIGDDNELRGLLEELRIAQRHRCKEDIEDKIDEIRTSLGKHAQDLSTFTRAMDSTTKRLLEAQNM